MLGVVRSVRGDDDEDSSGEDVAPVQPREGERRCQSEGSIGCAE